MNIWNGPWFTEYINPLATWISLATFIVTVSIWFMVRFGQKRRFNRWRKAAIRFKGTRPAALIVDAIGKGASLQARQHAMHDLNFEDEELICEYVVGKGAIITVEQMPEVLSGLKSAIAEVSAMGADRVYLYVSAPTPISLVIGAELANYGGVVLMHWNNQDGAYENWGPLRYTGQS